MSMKNELGMMSMLTALAIMGTETSHIEHEYVEAKEDEGSHKQKFEIEKAKVNGLKEFFLR